MEGRQRGERTGLQDGHLFGAHGQYGARVLRAHSSGCSGNARIPRASTNAVEGASYTRACSTTIHYSLCLLNRCGPTNLSPQCGVCAMALGSWETAPVKRLRCGSADPLFGGYDGLSRRKDFDNDGHIYQVLHLLAHMCIHMHTNTRTRTSTRVHTRTDAFTRTHTHTYTYIHECVYVCI